MAGVANRGVRHLGHGSCHQPFWHAVATRRNVGHVDEDEVEFKWVSPRYYGAMAWENVRRVTCLNFDEVVLRLHGRGPVTYFRATYELIRAGCRFEVVFQSLLNVFATFPLST